MEKGLVKWFDPKKGFGFVVNEQGQDVFVHYTSIVGDDEGFRCLRSGQEVEYQQVANGEKLLGKDVRIIEEASGNYNVKSKQRRSSTKV